jgi:hypothetical protein
MSKRRISVSITIGHLLGFLNAYAMIDAVAGGRYVVALFHLIVMQMIANRL